MKKILEIKNLSFTYDDTSESSEEVDKISRPQTLKDVSFDVYEGEWVSIIGRNGSGKSTTARLIAGLIPAESGTITIDGDILTEDNVWDLRRKLGMVFQNPDNQFVGATVEDDIAFGMENQEIVREEMVKRVNDVLHLVDMTEFRDREPARLSGGQKQRVAIAGIIALRPNIIILDEATSMLDPNGRLELMKVIRSVKEEYNLTVLSITHDLDEASLSDRIIVMKDGCVVESSSPEQLFSKGDELISMGLDIPFSSSLAKELKSQGYDLPDRYMNESELAEELWQSYLKK
jgi:ABC-type cobalt transport system, ATPase component